MTRCGPARKTRRPKRRLPTPWDAAGSTGESKSTGIPFGRRCVVNCQAMLWIGCLLLLSETGVVRPAWAEPSAAIQFLMKEPVSMMDWGIKNTENYLYRQRALLIGNGNPLFEAEPTIAVAYDWEDNRIRISIGLRTGEPLQKTPRELSDIRSHVEWVVKYLRGSLTMKPYDAFFRHNGFRSKESPQNLESELAGLTELIVTVRDRESNILSRCRAPLAGGDLVWLTIGDP